MSVIGDPTHRPLEEALEAFRAQAYRCRDKFVAEGLPLPDGLERFIRADGGVPPIPKKKEKQRALRLGLHGKAVELTVNISEIADKLSNGTIRHLRMCRHLTPARARFYAGRLLWLADLAEEVARGEAIVLPSLASQPPGGTNG